ncbi:hypothetical protein FISHEDRAFT_72446 [Fistulina hepatica ATCC 64428]|uniref:Uncharacterized protein n=1 Tax=Fistulina hepatica ATCC 64428 TaxID=1128425 RepID=A0A0D7AEL1_9AGAR|nr:hypothetical protein FISHEDRAFT_72446 [Fistulina hepatica ATCC 64428]
MSQTKGYVLVPFTHNSGVPVYVMQLTELPRLTVASRTPTMNAEQFDDEVTRRHFEIVEVPGANNGDVVLHMETSLNSNGRRALSIVWNRRAYRLAINSRDGRGNRTLRRTRVHGPVEHRLQISLPSWAHGSNLEFAMQDGALYISWPMDCPQQLPQATSSSASNAKTPASSSSVVSDAGGAEVEGERDDAEYEAGTEAAGEDHHRPAVADERFKHADTAT